MPRLKKDAKILNIKLDRRINDKLDIYCKDVGISKTLAIENILNQFLEKQDKIKE